LKRFLKSRIGTNFKLGVLEKEFLVLYYAKSWETKLGLDEIPIVKVTVDKREGVAGRPKIVFRLANFVFVFLILLPIVIFLLAYRGGFAISIWSLIMSFAGSYLLAMLVVRDQSKRFEEDMRGLISS